MPKSKPSEADYSSAEETNPAGVYCRYTDQGEKYIASIHRLGRTWSLGTYNTPEEADKIYKAAHYIFDCIAIGVSVKILVNEQCIRDTLKILKDIETRRKYKINKKSSDPEKDMSNSAKASEVFLKVEKWLIRRKQILYAFDAAEDLLYPPVNPRVTEGLVEHPSFECPNLFFKYYTNDQSPNKYPTESIEEPALKKTRYAL